MFDVVSVNEIRAAEARAKTYGLNEDMLIENAAAALFARIRQFCNPDDRVAVLCGHGNNGADGFSLARLMHLNGYHVRVFVPSGKGNDFAQARKTACLELGVAVVELKTVAELDLSGCRVVVDALLGTGLNKPTDGVFAALIERLNAAGVYTVAVDIPSGLHADTGACMGSAVTANETLAFGAAKLGHLLGEGRNHTGKLTVVDIGVRTNSRVKACDGNDLTLPPRLSVSHKYNYGRVCIVGGSPSYVGAPLLCALSAEAALRCGAGLVSLCVPNSQHMAYAQRVLESTLACLPDKNGYVVYDENCLRKLMQKTNAFAIGMGMGDNPDLPKILRFLSSEFEGVLVIDADGLNALCKDISVLSASRSKIILTPHLGEFARLSASVGILPAPLSEQSRLLAQKLDCVVAVKNATTVITDGKDVFLNTTGTPAMAKGGSGDVLAGMIAAFSTRMPVMQATLSACYHFGRCGEAAEQKLGVESVLASDLVAEIRGLQ